MLPATGTRNGPRHGAKRALFAFALLSSSLFNPCATAQTPDGWDWSAALASNRNEFANDIAVDPVNNAVYAAGMAEDGYSGILGGLWALLFGNSTNSDGYLAKRTLDGTLQWQVVVGGTGEDQIFSVCVGSAGEVFVTGYFNGNASFTGTGGNEQTTSSAGENDIFVACYSTNGALLWLVHAGSTGDDEGRSIRFADGKLFVGGFFHGLPGIAGLPSSIAVPNVNSNSRAFLVALDATDGNGLWRVDGYNNGNSSFRAVATDGSMVYALGTHQGASYNYASPSGSFPQTLPTPSANGTSANILAVAMDGTFQWTQAVVNPTSGTISANGLTASAYAVYIGGSTCNGSIFPGGTAVNGGNNHPDYAYVARLNKTDGSTTWVRTMQNSDDEDNVHAVRSLTWDDHGDILLVGTYADTITFPGGRVVTGDDDTQVFVAKCDADGTFKWAITPDGEGEDIPTGVCVDGAGHVYIAGGFKQDINFDSHYDAGSSWSLFAARLADLDYAVADFRDPSVFNPLQPLCASAGPQELGSLLVPHRAGAASAVYASYGIAMNPPNGPGAALGQAPGGVAVLDDPGDQLVIDIGETIPTGARVIIRWASTGGAGTLNVQGSLSGAGGYTDHGDIITTSTALVLEAVTAIAPVRFLKLTRGGATDCVVDGVFYNFGSATGGAWSGTGVSGSTFDPAGLSGNVGITYTVLGYSTTHLVHVDPISVAGTLAGGGVICPGTDATLYLTGQVGTSILWSMSTNGGSLWTIDTTSQADLPLINVTQPTLVKASVKSGVCPAMVSNMDTIIPLDTIPPVMIDCPSNITVFSEPGQCGAHVHYALPTATDNCTSIVAIAPADLAQASGSLFAVGTTTVQIAATDSAGNTATCSFDVVVEDNTDPAISGCPANITLGAGANCSAVATWGAPSVSDNCTGTTLASSHNSGDSFPIGTTTVTCTATDAAGNTATCSFTVSVADNTSPVISGCPANITRSAGANCSATATWAAPSVSDNCTGATLSASHNSGDSFPIGTTTVTYTATDAAGNTATCSFTVSVADNTGPMASCQNTTIGLDLNGVAFLTAAQVDNGSTDNCGIADISVSPDTFNTVGTYPVVLSVTDVSGNSSTCTAMVTVTDNHPPTAVCQDNTIYLDLSGNAEITAMEIDGGSHDNGSITGMTISQTHFDCSNIGANNVALIVTDDAGITGQCTALVTVLDTLAPAVICQGITLGLNTTGHASITAAQLDGGSSDNCTIASITASRTTFSCADLGNTPITLTVTDASGNSSTCTATVTLTDTLGPLIENCPEDLTMATEQGQCGAHVAYTLPTAMDNCSGSVAVAPANTAFTPGMLFPVGTTTVQLEAFDGSGNVGSCSFNITVIDDQEPVLGGCSDQEINVQQAGACGAVVVYPAITAVDECGGNLVPVRTAGPASGAWFPYGTIVVTHEASFNGLTGMCSFNVTVNDSAPPTFTVGTMPIAQLDGNNEAVLPDLFPFLENITDCSGVGGHAQLPPAGSVITENTWVDVHVADQLGNDTLVHLLVSVTDTIPPSVVCGGPVQVSVLPGQCSTQVFLPAPQMADNSGMVTLVDSSGTYGSGDWFPAGTHFITYVVADPAGLMDSCTTTVDVVAPPVPQLAYSASQFCTNSSPLLPATASPSGGAFSCADGGLVLNNATGEVDAEASAPGVYHVIYAFSGPCPAQASFSLEIIAAPSAGSNGSVQLCSSGQEVQLLNALGGAPDPAGTWSGPSNLANGLFHPGTDEPGSYVYTVTGSGPCAAASALVEVEVVNAAFAGTDSSLAVCSSGSTANLFSLLAGAQPGGQWSIGGNAHSGQYDPALDVPGTYIYTLDSLPPCPGDEAAITVAEQQAPDAGTSNVLDLCADADPVNLFNALGGSANTNGQWTDAGGTVIDPLFDPGTDNGGSFTYIVNGTPPCANASAVVTVNVIAPPSANWVVPGPMCSNGAPLDLNPIIAGDAGGTWSGNGIAADGHHFDPQLIDITGNSTDAMVTYSIALNGCSSSQNGAITVIASPLADAGPNASVCGLTHQLQAGPAVGDGAWSSTGTNVSFAAPAAPATTVTVPGPGTYVLQWTVSNGPCSDADTVAISFHLPEELTALDAGPDQVQNIIHNASLHGVADGATEMHWTVVAGSGTFTDSHAAATEVQGLSIGHNVLLLNARVGVCPYEKDSVAITVNDLFIPSGFSPNDDGVNDRFEVVGADVLKDGHLQVFNRWGQLVYQAKNYANQWDGHGQNGHGLPDGTYFYVYAFPGAETYHGQVIIKR